FSTTGASRPRRSLVAPGLVGRAKVETYVGRTAVRFTPWAPAAVVALLLFGGVALADTGKKPAKEESSFGAMKAVDAAEAQKQAEAWLKDLKKDAATLGKFRTIWAEDRPLIDKVAATFVLGDPAAAKLLAEARDADSPAPTQVPVLLKDKKKPAFYRANL